MIRNDPLNDAYSINVISLLFNKYKCVSKNDGLIELDTEMLNRLMYVMNSSTESFRINSQMYDGFSPFWRN